MLIRFAKQTEIENWNQYILSNPDSGNIAQSFELSKLKLEYGWKPHYIFAKNIAITVHERTIPFLGKFWYIPKGPGITTTKDVSKLIEPLKAFASKHGAFLIKIEPEIIRNDNNLSTLKKLGLIPANPIQPNSSTVILDTSKKLDEIMSDLPQKARHAIKRAKRDGIETKQAEPSEQNFDTMLKLMNETMSDKPGIMRETSYYKKFWKSYTDNGNGALFFAFQNGQPTAGAFVLIFGDKATYKDGGSVRQKMGYGTSHALQWEIIEWLKKKKIKSYDLCGVPPISELDNKNHPHYGIGLFKTGFNKTVTEFVGLYDIAVKPVQYRIWQKTGGIFIRIYTKVLKQMFY